MVLQVSPNRDGLVGELEQPGVEQNSLSKRVPELGDFGQDAPKMRPETGPQVSVDQLLVGTAEPGKKAMKRIYKEEHLVVRGAWQRSTPRTSWNERMMSSERMRTLPKNSAIKLWYKRVDSEDPSTT